MSLSGYEKYGHRDSMDNGDMGQTEPTEGVAANITITEAWQKEHEEMVNMKALEFATHVAHEDVASYVNDAETIRHFILTGEVKA